MTCAEDAAWCFGSEVPSSAVITEHENWTSEWTEQPNVVQHGTRP